MWNRLYWLACLAVAACLISGAVPRTIGPHTQSSQPEFAWRSNGDLAVLSRPEPASVARLSGKPQSSAFRARGSALPEAESIPQQPNVYRLFLACEEGVDRGSDYLERSNDNPRAPPLTRSA
jgi:hypothetical protein